MIWEFLSPEYVKSKLDNLDIALTSLRDAIRGADGRTLSDLYSVGSGIKAKTDLLTFDANNYLRVNVSTTVNPPNLDVALSTRASESTLSALSGKFPSAASLADNLANPSTTIIGSALLGWDGSYWRRIATDTSSRLKINAEVVANPPNLDVALSTRASESTLTAVRDRLPSSLTSAGNFKIAILEDTVGLLKDSKIPNPLGVLTNLDVAGVTTNALGVIDMLTPARMPYMVENVAVSTTEASTSISAPGAKILVLKNKGDADILVGINGSVPTTNPLKIRPRTVKVITHKGVTSVSYKTATGTSTLDIEYYN